MQRSLCFFQSISLPLVAHRLCFSRVLSTWEHHTRCGTDCSIRFVVVCEFDTKPLRWAGFGLDWLSPRKHRGQRECRLDFVMFTQSWHHCSFGLQACRFEVVEVVGASTHSYGQGHLAHHTKLTTGWVGRRVDCKPLSATFIPTLTFGKVVFWCHMATLDGCTTSKSQFLPWGFFWVAVP